MSSSPPPNNSDDGSSSSTTKKKLELKTFTDLTRDNQIKVVLYLVGALILIMLGVSGLSGGLNIGSGIMAAIGLGGGAVTGYTGYNILIDPKNEKKCNAAFWTVTNTIGFDKDDYTSDLGTTLCKAQIKAEYDGYAGFYCVSNTETENTIDAYYITLTDSKKLTLRTSGTSNVFTIKSGDNKISVTEPPGSFTIAFTSVSPESVTITATNFDRIDVTKDANLSIASSPGDSGSPISNAPNTVSIQNLKDGYTIPSSSSSFQSGTMFNITAFSTTQNGLAVTRSLRLNLVTSPAATSPSSP